MHQFKAGILEMFALWWIVASVLSFALIDAWPEPITFKWVGLLKLGSSYGDFTPHLFLFYYT